MELRERNTETLKEKLRAKFHDRDFKPQKDHSNSIAMSMFFVVSITSLAECLVYLVPKVFPDNRILLSFVTFLIFCETIINWHRSYFDVLNYVRGETKEKHFPNMQETPPDWKQCFKCQVDVPPRSFHCNYCGKCMLKREHHCFVTGSCVGFYNQKFFMVFCLWSVLGSVYCAYLQLSYLSADLPTTSSGIATYILPISLYYWITGYISFQHLFIIAHLYMSVFMAFVAFLFLFWQVFVTAQGLTSYEGWKKIFAFQGETMSENLRSVFGSLVNIPVLILFPIRFEQEGDGIQWKIRSKRIKGH